MSTSVPLSKEKSEPEAVGILSAADALNLLISLPSGVAGKLSVQGADATDLHPDGRGTVRVAGVELEIGGAGLIELKSGAVGCGQSRSGHEVRCFDSYRIQQNDPRSTGTRPVR